MCWQPAKYALPEPLPLDYWTEDILQKVRGVRRFCFDSCNRVCPADDWQKGTTKLREVPTTKHRL